MKSLDPCLYFDEASLFLCRATEDIGITRLLFIDGWMSSRQSFRVRQTADITALYLCSTWKFRIKVPSLRNGNAAPAYVGRDRELLLTTGAGPCPKALLV